MRKQVRILAALLTLTTLQSKAQTPLPYNTGFDNAAQQAGWGYYAEGVQDPMQLGWMFGITTPKSAPNYLYHSYWGDATSFTKDWIVSPAFNFSSGAVLRCAMMVYAFSPTTSDSINIYLLNGSQNPGMATKTLLGAYAQKALQTYTWDSTGAVNIPPTSGTSYIAFKYVGLNNWFEVGIDDLRITASTTDVKDLNAELTPVQFYPNPAANMLYWHWNSAKDKRARVIDITGKEVVQFSLQARKLDISALPAGIYIIEVGSQRHKFTK